MPHLYLSEDNQPIITHSMIKAFRRCPRLALYKYYDRLKPKVQPQALRRGTWIHSLLEEHYKGGDWKTVHTNLVEEYDQLFEEEQEALGSLPDDISKIMRSYFWHYKKDEDWKILEVEYTLDVELPDNTIYRCRVDLLVETPWGLYIVDHKSHKQLPWLDFRLRDPQSALYIWAFRKAGIPVQGFIWNYIKYIPPKPIRFNKNGSLSKRQGETDFLTAYQSIKEQDRDPQDFKEILLPLQRQRYSFGSPQTSSFFRRDVLEKDDGMLERIITESLHTSQRMSEYPFKHRDGVERVSDRSCGWCSYKDLCTVELFGGNKSYALRQFREGDPLDYYQDQKDVIEVN